MVYGHSVRKFFSTANFSKRKVKTVKPDTTQSSQSPAAMRASHESIPVSYRLLGGGFLLLPLWFINMEGVSSVSANVRLALLQGAVSITAIVLLVPVVIRGDWVQRILAVILMLFPTLSLVGAFLLAVGYL